MHALATTTTTTMMTTRTTAPRAAATTQSSLRTCCCCWSSPPAPGRARASPSIAIGAASASPPASSWPPHQSPPRHAAAAAASSWPPHQSRPRHAAAAAASSSSSSPSSDAGDAAAAGERAYANLFNARVFADPDRQAEFERCTSDLRDLGSMAGRFPDMDPAGKRLFLRAMEEGTERYRIFVARLELAAPTDPAAAAYLQYSAQQMAAGGFSLGAMFDGLAQSLERYRQIADAEERAEAAGPAEAQRFRAALRDEWGQSALGAIDLGQLQALVDPETIARAQADPEFYRAIREISESPTPDVLARWISHPRIGPLVTAMSKLMLQKRGLGGVGGEGS
jgi:hypothetical protein